MAKYGLVGQDGNVFNLMGYTSRAMKKEGFTKAEIDEVLNEAMASSDYDHALCVLDAAIQRCNQKNGED